MAPHDKYGYWPYDPSKAAPIVATVLYAITTAVTIFQFFKYRAWVWIVVVLAALLELAGFIARIISSRNWDAYNPYVIQFVLVIIAPVLMAAGYYVVFGRIVFRVLPAQYVTWKVIWAPPRFLTPIFVTCDIVAFFLQCAGAAIVVSAQPTDSDYKSKENLGKDVVLIGLVVQIVAFGLFSIIAARFHFVGRRLALPNSELDLSTKGGKRKLNPHWGRLLTVVNVACLCILARSVYRMVEFGQGVNGYSQTHEWPFWVFDFLPIFPCVALFNIWHPSMFLPHLGFRQPKAIQTDHVQLESVDA